MKKFSSLLFCLVSMMVLNPVRSPVPVEKNYQVVVSPNDPTNPGSTSSLMTILDQNKPIVAPVHKDDVMLEAKKTSFEKQLENFKASHYSPIDLTMGSAASFDSSPDYVQAMEDQMEPLEDDYKNVLTNFKKIGCFQSDAQPLTIENIYLGPLAPKNDTKTKQSNPYSVCEGDLADALFSPLGSVNTHVSNIYNHLNNNIYKPLSYKVYPDRFSYSDALHDMLFLDKDNLMIKKDLPIPDFTQFQSMILGGFAEIANYASNFDANKPIISKLILDILKHFHIYWNVKRQQNQIDSTKINTYSILKKIIQRYREENYSMKATTLHLLHNIREGYFKFVKAHKMHQMMTKNAAEMVVYQFLKRYDLYVKVLREGRFRVENYFYELSVFLELYRTILNINLNRGMKDDANIQYVKKNIHERITNMYLVYEEYMIKIKDERLEEVTQFTAVLLLKLTQRQEVMAGMYSIEGFIRREPFKVKSVWTTHVKTFYELMDYWMVIPGKCADITKLRICTQSIGLRMTNKFKLKENLHISVGGAHFYRFLREVFHELVANMDAKDGFSNPESYRNLYFSELFKISEKIRMTYLIKDMSTVDDLQNQIGILIEKEKSREGVPIKVIKLLAKLDESIYDFWLTIKDQYNKKSPVENSAKIMNEIKFKTGQFFNKFVTDNSDANEPFIEGLFDLFKKVTDNWTKKYLNKFTSAIDNDVAMTPGTSYMPLPVQGSIAVDNIIKEAQIDSGAQTPIYMGSNFGN